MPTNIKPNQVKDPELDLASGYDYKKQIDKIVIRLYLHTVALLGIVLTIVGLAIYEPVPKWAAIALIVLGAIVMLVAYHFENKLRKV